MIELKAGYRICTAGWQRVLINNTLHTLTPGKMQLLSPAFLIEELDQSEDFLFLELTGDVQMLFPTMRSVLPEWIPSILEHPVVRIDSVLIDDTRRAIAEIAALNEQIATSPDASHATVINKLIEVTTLKAILNIFYQAFCLKPLPLIGGKTVSPVILQFFASLHLNFAQHRDVAWYASQANMSTGYFSRSIRKTIGKSPSQIIALFVTQTAKSLLKKSEKSIKEISQELGFPEQFTFRKYFKVHTGMSPTHYRKAARLGSI